jgi:hypothetical protein
MQNVMLCDRQMCVDCQLCFIAEGTDCYYILYILTVTVYKTVLQVHSQTLHTLHTHAHLYANFAVIKFIIFTLQ